MPVEPIFLLQFALSLLVIALLAAWYLGPALSTRPLHIAIGVLLIPHAFRHVGLVFMVPGVVSPDLAQGFASSAGFGDLAAALLALTAMVALRLHLPGALLVAWIFSIVGIVDLANALRQAEVIPHFQAAWYIPTFFVPLLLVTHLMIVVRLIRAARGAEAAVPSPS